MDELVLCATCGEYCVQHGVCVCCNKPLCQFHVRVGFDEDRPACIPCMKVVMEEALEKRRLNNE